MVVVVIYALYLLQANSANIPTPIWVLAWVGFGLAILGAISTAFDKQKRLVREREVLALLTKIERNTK